MMKRGRDGFVQRAFFGVDPRWSLVLILVFSGPANLSAQPAAKADSVFPKLTARIDDETYERRLTAGADALKEARERAKGEWPITGILLQEVFKDSSAEKLGLKPGDILMRFDELVIWTSVPLPRLPEIPQRCEYFSAEQGKKRSVSVPPGLLGIEFIDYWKPELAYLRSKAADSKWDADVVLAIQTASTDPDLSETAWSKAVAKGYKPEAQFLNSGILSAFARGNAEDAWRFAEISRRKQWEPNELHPSVLFRAAVANHQLDEMTRLVTDYPHVFEVGPDDIQALKRLDEKRPAGERTSPPPHEQAEKMYRDDLLPRLVAQRQSTAVHTLAALKSGAPLDIKADPAFFQEEVVSSPGPARDIDVSFKFTWKPSPGDGKGFRKVFISRMCDGTFDPADPSSPMEVKPTIVSVMIDDETYGLGFNPASNGFHFVDLSPRFRSGEQSFRFVRVGGRAELFLNDCRVADLPADESIDRPWLMLKSVGSQVTIRDLRFVELIEKK